MYLLEMLYTYQQLIRAIQSFFSLEWRHMSQRATGIDSVSSEIRLSLRTSYAEYWENEIRNIQKHPICGHTHFLKQSIPQNYISL